MPTIGDSLSFLEERLFFGREREIAEFQSWLIAGSGAEPVLNVTGHGGVGKSTLLRAFARQAVRLGRKVIWLDSREFRHTAEGLLAAIGAPSWQDPIEYINKNIPLILFDTYEELFDLGRYLIREFLPRLEIGVKVVFAGRYPLVQEGVADSVWRQLIRPMVLAPFSPEECRDYLRHRGVQEDGLLQQIVHATAGNPLALSLAADLALQMGVREFGALPEWHMVVRSLVEQLLKDVSDPLLRELLEASSIVRQFDESTLEAVSGRTGLGSAFRQLCGLSAIRPVEHGVTLHDDVRRALAEDLRWRRPERYHELRMRAIAYYRERAKTAPPSEREWLMTERIYLWGNSLMQQMAFQEGEPDQVWMEAARPEDHEALKALWEEGLRRGLSNGISIEPPAHDLETLAAMLRYHGTQVRVARDRLGRLLGFRTVLPLCLESIDLLRKHPGLWPLVEAYRQLPWVGELPPTPAETRVYYLIHVAQAETMPEATRATLIRDLFGLLTMDAIVLVTTPFPDYKGLLEALGFHRVPEAHNLGFGAHAPADGYVRDLGRIGVDAWFEAILNGRRPPQPLSREEWEQELQQALVHWENDAELAGSRLYGAMALPETSPGALRAALQQALVQAQRSAADPGEGEPYRAVELGYLTRGLTHERAAERMRVSRATFYRLLKRGVQGLATLLSQTPVAGSGIRV